MNIAILGAGTGGLTAALALHQAGFNVEVYERHKAHNERGAGIVLWPNANFVLSKLGLIGQVAQVSGQIKAMKRLSHMGEKLGTVEVTKLNALMKFPSYSILRKDLQDILASRVTELGITVNFQHRVTQITENPENKAIVIFENGNQITPDIVIGFDGRMNSISRLYVNNDNTPVYQSFINWVGIFKGDNKLKRDSSLYLREPEYNDTKL